MALDKDKQKQYDDIFSQDPFQYNDTDTMLLFVGRNGPLSVEFLFSGERVDNSPDGVSVILSADEAWKLHAWLEKHITYRPRVI